MSFRALVLRKEEGEAQVASIDELELSALPDEDVLIEVVYSTLNYKDGLCVTSGGGLVRKYPHIPGVDFSGRVIESRDVRYKPGDDVLVSGWRVGEIFWGGYAERARVKADFLVPMPKGMSHLEAMGIGTAGLTAMYGVMALERAGVTPESGPIVVTGAAGGVGSVALVILTQLGFEVHAVSGRSAQTDYLKSLGAKAVIARDEVNVLSKRPLESEQWAGVIDNVGGEMLARLLGQIKYNGVAVAIGLAGGAHLPATVIPFLLRGISLIGIDSVMRPYADRIQAWGRLRREFPFEKLNHMIEVRPLSDVLELAPAILKGQVRGRVVIDVKA